jgi:hypothetical protein
VLKTTLRAAAAALGIASAHAAPPTGVPHPTDTMVFSYAGNLGNCGGCQWISAEGPITERTPQDFETFLKTSRFLASTLLLNSNGGNLAAGLRLGEAIRAHKLSTQVGRSVAPAPPHADDPNWIKGIAPGHCWSSCAYAFLGGVNRFARSGELGFHQFRAAPEPVAQADTDPMKSAQETMGMLVFYLREMAVEPALLSLATTADPTSLYQPDAEAMFKLNVVNMSDKQLFGGWSIEPYRSGAVVTGKLSAEAEQTAGLDAVSTEIIPEQQMSFFCRAQAPGKVFLLGSWRYGDASDALIRSIIFGSTVLIGGQPVRQVRGDGSIADLHVGSGRMSLTYALDTSEFTAALTRGKLEIKIDVPHALSESYEFRFAPPMTGLAAATRIAFKSCL